MQQARAHGAKGSQQREIILEELRKLKSHPRSDELYLLVRQRLPHISLATVYRNLDRLQHEGLALEIYCGDFVRYDGNALPHDHFMCRDCRRVWDLDLGLADPPEATPRLESGFQIEGRYTIYHGLCADCRQQEQG